MAATDYTYSIIADFPNQKVNSSRLTEEIQESAIITALDFIGTNGESCDIWFKDALSVGDVVVLDGVVAAHSGEPLDVYVPQPVKIIDAEDLPETAVSSTEDIEVPVVTGESVSKKNVSFPFIVSIIAAEYYVDIGEWSRGDYFEVWGISSGDPYIGTTTAPAIIGQTVIYVGQTVFANLRPGYFVEFQDLVDDVYRVESMSSAAGTITLNRGLNADVASGKFIHPRRPFVVKKFAEFKEFRRVGDLQSGSSSLAIGDTLRIRYHHKNAPTADDFLFFTVIYMF